MYVAFRNIPGDGFLCKRTFMCGTKTNTWGADAMVGVQFKELPVAFCLLLELPKRESNFIYLALVISLFE